MSRPTLLRVARLAVPGLAALAALAACGFRASEVRGAAGGATASPGDGAFAALRDRTVDEIYELQPELAVEVGLHDHDGRLTDKSRAGLDTLRARMWPGHFLQWLYNKKQPSRVLKAFCSYANVEGWAHYAEEMMWDAGLGGGDPRVRVGMLLSALTRNARFVAALGLHTAGMSVEEATRVFQEKAFMPLAGARQQAVRGTFDPFYSSYTLGKLMIVKLRDDWKAKLEAEGKGKEYTLQAFHETLLNHGCASLSVVRETMVGGGPSL